MISIEDLVFTYPRGAFKLRIPSFSVAKYEKVAIIGPSGTGKTTLLNIVAGILPVKSEMVKVAGQDLGQLSDRQRRRFRISNIGFIFQDFALLDYLKVKDNIIHPYRISRALKVTAEVKRRAEMVARELGVAHHLEEYPAMISHGERQRVATCRALLAEPKLILADEPTGNLDPDNKDRILDLLFASVEKHGASLLAVTHDHDLLRNFDRVVDFHSFLVENEP